MSISPVKSPSLSNELVEPPRGSVASAAAVSAAVLPPPAAAKSASLSIWFEPTVELIKPAVGLLTLFSASCICSGVACVASKPIKSLRAFIPASMRPSKLSLLPMLDVDVPITLLSKPPSTSLLNAPPCPGKFCAIPLPMPSKEPKPPSPDPNCNSCPPAVVPRIFTISDKAASRSLIGKVDR